MHCQMVVVAYVDGRGLLELILVRNNNMRLTERDENNMITFLCILNPLPSCIHHNQLPILFDCYVLFIGGCYWCTDGFVCIKVEFSSS